MIPIGWQNGPQSNMIGATFRALYSGCLIRIDGSGREMRISAELSELVVELLGQIPTLELADNPQLVRYARAVLEREEQK